MSIIFCQIYKYTRELKQFKMKSEHIIWAQRQGAWFNQQQNMQFTPLLSLPRENTAVKRRAFATVFTYVIFEGSIPILVQ